MAVPYNPADYTTGNLFNLARTADLDSADFTAHQEVSKQSGWRRAQVQTPGATLETRMNALIRDHGEEGDIKFRAEGERLNKALQEIEDHQKFSPSNAGMALSEAELKRHGKAAQEELATLQRKVNQIHKDISGSNRKIFTKIREWKNHHTAVFDAAERHTGFSSGTRTVAIYDLAPPGADRDALIELVRKNRAAGAPPVRAITRINAQELATARSALNDFVQENVEQTEAQIAKDSKYFEDLYKDLAAKAANVETVTGVKAGEKATMATTAAIGAEEKAAEGTFGKIGTAFKNSEGLGKTVVVAGSLVGLKGLYDAAKVAGVVDKGTNSDGTPVTEVPGGMTLPLVEIGAGLGAAYLALKDKMPAAAKVMSKI